MKPNDIARRDIVKSIALSPAAAFPLLPVAQAAAAPLYVPRYLSAAELEVVATLGELIIPQTDTPGARAALAHEHIDLVLSESTDDERHDFRDGLQWLDRRSRELFGSPFHSLDREKQTALLTRISNRKSLRPEDERGHRFFLDLRSRVVFAYYTSEAGLIGELTYKGKHVLGHWEGCPHPDHHGDAE